MRTKAVEKQSALCRRYVGGELSRCYWTLDRPGHLQVRAEEGLITTVKKLPDCDHSKAPSVLRTLRGHQISINCVPRLRQDCQAALFSVRRRVPLFFVAFRAVFAPVPLAPA